MKRIFLLLLVLLSMSTLTLAQETAILSRDDINRIADSVVQIITFSRGEPVSTGSGTIIDGSGLIYTNRHVVEGGDDFAILMLDDINEFPVLRYFASVVGQSDEIDFALLQVDRDADRQALVSQNLNLPFLPISMPDIQRGDHIYVFGYPGIGDGYLVFTEGTITTIQNGTVNGQRLPAWYQTDAEIGPGNSGGLAVNGRGELVGIPTEVRGEDRTGARLGGILPINAILAVLEGDRIVAPTKQQDQPSATDTTLVVDLLNTEHNVTIEGSDKLGMKVNTYIRATGYRDLDIRAAIFYYWVDGTPISAENAAESDRTPNGYLTVQTILTPQYDDTEWTDFWFWLPYDAFPSGLSGVQDAYVQVEIGLDREAFIAASNTLSFQLEYSGSQAHDGKSQTLSALDYTLEPAFGLASLNAGFRPDPYSIRMTSGGNVDVSYLGSACSGYAAAAPDLRLAWGGGTGQLRVYFESDTLHADTTLIVNLPDGTWVCNDDFDNTTRNPMIVLNSPIAGQYDIWVGSYASGEFIVGALSLSELNVRP